MKLEYYETRYLHTPTMQWLRRIYNRQLVMPTVYIIRYIPITRG